MNKKELLRNTLLKEAYLMVNKSLIRSLGIDSAIFISDLISKEKYFENTNKIKDGWFFNTVENRKEDTGLSKFQQRNVIKKVVKTGILQVKRKGIPPRQYFKINHSLLFSLLTLKGKETEPLINKNNINKNSIINNTKESSDSFQFKSPFIKKCILSWNEISFTQNIRITQRTKTITKLERYIAQLLNGTFTHSRGNKTFDEEWFNKNKIPLPFSNLTKKQILVTIKKTSLYGKEGYFTEDKSYMPKDLTTLMYNPRTGKSWFLLAYYRTPKPFDIIRENPSPKTTEYLRYQLNEGKLYTNSDNLKLFSGVKSIMDFTDSIPEQSLKQHKIRSEVGTPLKICKEYIYWLEHQDWIDEIKLPILNANNKAWKMFIKSKEEEYEGYQLT